MVLLLLNSDRLVKNLVSIDTRFWVNAGWRELLAMSFICQTFYIAIHIWHCVDPAAFLIVTFEQMLWALYFWCSSIWDTRGVRCWVSHRNTAIQIHDGIYLILLKSVESTLRKQQVCRCSLSCSPSSDESLLFSNVHTLQVVSLKKCGKVCVL